MSTYFLSFLIFSSWSSFVFEIFSKCSSLYLIKFSLFCCFIKSIVCLKLSTFPSLYIILFSNALFFSLFSLIILFANSIFLSSCSLRFEKFWFFNFVFCKFSLINLLYLLKLFNFSVI